MSVRLGVCAIAVAAVFAGLPLPPKHERDLVLYNHSPSMPVGFYARIKEAPDRGAVVTVRALDAAPEEARRRHFDRPGDRFLKRVAASAGDHVCAQGRVITINGRTAALRRTRDSRGHALAQWQGCRVLASGELFLLGDATDSFDHAIGAPSRGVSSKASGAGSAPANLPDDRISP
jgi:type IV secretory pathway protease TraF